MLILVSIKHPKEGAISCRGGAPSPADWASLSNEDKVRLKCTDSDVITAVWGWRFPHFAPGR